jgi:hypothetical protein
MDNQTSATCPDQGYCKIHLLTSPLLRFARFPLSNLERGLIHADFRAFLPLSNLERGLGHRH